VVNHVNFPDGDFQVNGAEPVYEVPNVFPCWGSTYILSEPADRLAAMPGSWLFSRKRPDDDYRLVEELAGRGLFSEDGSRFTIDDLPRSLKIAIAGGCGEPEILEQLARSSCGIEFDDNGRPSGLCFEQRHGRVMPVIRDHDLFKAVVANPALPDDYKVAMILMPGIQGGNPVVGEYRNGETHIWEYLRANSYIPWGHFASNMAQDSVRYNIKKLSPADMTGLRHLYYQRMFTKLERSLVEAGRIAVPDIDAARYGASGPDELEALRVRTLKLVRQALERGDELPFNSTLWGWNYGFGISHSGYRMHASNQQIHQQFALIPSAIEESDADKGAGGRHVSYAAGDHVAETSALYRRCYDRSFFEDYLSAIRNNRRTDGRKDIESSLVIFEDENAMLFVPKAQRSQAELHLMAKRRIATILDADSGARASFDYMIWLAVRLLVEAGAEMVTCCEMSGRFDDGDTDQRLIYYFLPRHPLSPGSFSEHQGRWITGHYPEDVAAALRGKLEWIIS
jgi:hypothetical protein